MRHGVKFLPFVDNIIVIKEGRISEMGTYEELLDQGNEFANFLIQYKQEEEEKHLDGELNLVNKGELANIMGKIHMNRQRLKASSIHSNAGVSTNAVS